MALLREILLPSVNYSNQDLTRRNRGTFAPGPIYPVLIEECLPGDTFSINSNALLKTYPTQSPIYGSFRQRLAFFFVPTRLYTQSMDTNRIMFDPSTTIFPTFYMKSSSNTALVGKTYPSEYVNYTIPKACLQDWLGISQGSLHIWTGSVGDQPYLNATTLIGYYDIFRTYYANTQEPNFYFYKAFDLKPVDGSEPTLSTTKLSYIDDFIQKLISTPGAQIDNWFFGSGSQVWSPVNNSRDYVMSGLCMSTHRPDFFTAWLSQGVYNQMVQSSKINVESNTITVNQIRFSNHMAKFFERGLVAGGHYDDWVESQFGVSTSKTLCIPELLGVISSDIVFDEVVSQSNTPSDSASSSGLGDLGGRGSGFLEGRTIHFTSSENGYLMAMYTITPNVDYSQGIKPYLFKTQYLNTYQPEFQHLGFQPLPKAYLSYIPNLTITNGKITSILPESPMTIGVGYQPAFTEYMTATNELHGDFGYGGDLYYWCINRQFSRLPSVPSASAASMNFNATSYVIPNQFNYPFRNSSVTSSNFLVQFVFAIHARRAFAKSVMPSL